MKYFIALFASVLWIALPSSAQCSGFDRNLESALNDYRYYSNQHPIVSAAFDDVMGEMITVLQKSPQYWSNPDKLTFDEIAPALGSLILFAVVCDANQPHCDRFLAKVDPVVGSLLFNLGAGYAASCWR